MLDMESALPLYAQVKEALVRQIRMGSYQPHQLLPPERSLMEQFGVSRITVRRALTDMTAEGLVYRKGGRGTYVASEPIVETLTELVGHLEELQRRNLEPDVTIVDQGFRPPPPDVAEALGDTSGMLFARRLIRVEGVPLLLLDLYLPGEIGVDMDKTSLVGLPIHKWLERRGALPYAGEQRVAARAIQGREAELLGVAAGTPGLEVVRTEWNGAGGGLLWSRALYRGDRYQYIIKLQRRRRA